MLNWYKLLAQLRRDNPALHNGGLVMLNKDNADVLSWVRTPPAGAAPVIVAINLSKDPKEVKLDLSGTGITVKAVKTLAASEDSLKNTTSLDSVKLPPYSAWIASVE